MHVKGHTHVGDIHGGNVHERRIIQRGIHTEKTHIWWEHAQDTYRVGMHMKGHIQQKGIHTVHTERIYIG